MTLEWEGADIDRQHAQAAIEERARLLERQVGESLFIANEFSEISVQRVETRNGTRLLIDSPKSGQWIALDPLELEALTWQTVKTFSEMLGNPDSPLFPDDVRETRE